MHRTVVILLWATCVLCAQGCAANAAASRASWERSRGGVAATSGEDARLSPARAEAALARVAPAGCPVVLRVAILQNAAPVAHSFKDGALYVSTGLLGCLTDDELAAVLAHELGHLMIDGILMPGPAALSGAPLAPAHDVELHADLVARTMLASRRIPANALTTALQKVAAASRGEPYYLPLTRRITTLKELDARGGAKEMDQNSDS